MYALHFHWVLHYKSKKHILKSLNFLKQHSYERREGKFSANNILIYRKINKLYLPLIAFVMMKDAPCLRLPLGCKLKKTYI